MKNPQAYDKLQQEIDEAATNGQLSSPVKYSESIRFPYLCACIKEALRLHPGVQLTMGRLTPAEGLELCGEFIPAGFRVGMNSAVIHYDESVFGDDASQFRPSRWLEGNTAAMDKNMLHFGAGTRTCIGKNISLAELHKLIPYVLRNFKVEMWEADKTWTTRNLWFCKQEGLDVRVIARTKME
jgi:cytochrome P450